MSKTIAIIHGANLNMLGKREPDVYGLQTQEDLVSEIRSYAHIRDIEVRFYQSNHEGDIIDYIHSLYGGPVNGVIINPGAFTHYSLALHDAIKCLEIPFIEVHLTDIMKREKFRDYSVIKPACIAQYYGEGIKGYFKALEKLANL
jgi:3-dehydroquinate dehydratase-2